MVCTMDSILRDFSISTDICPDPSKVANLLGQISTDLLVIDLDAESSIELVQFVHGSPAYQKPTILAVSARNRDLPGAHVVLPKPVTPDSGVQSLKTAYSRMLQDFRKHTRFALLATIFATDENNRTLTVTVTNVGYGGVGLITKERLVIGNKLSFRMPLPGLKNEIYVQARVLWTREYGAVGCEFVNVPEFDVQLLRAWLDSRYRIKKPIISV